MDTWITYLIIFAAKYLIVFSITLFIIFWYRAEPNIRRKLYSLSIISLPLSYIVARICRYFYFNPRPFVTSGISPLIAHAADNGFPSDHTLLAATLAAIVYACSKKWGIVMWFLTISIGLGRVFAGVHHLRDILTSILIALVVVNAIYYLIKISKNKNL